MVVQNYIAVTVSDMTTGASYMLTLLTHLVPGILIRVVHFTDEKTKAKME